ncbi:MAG: hypothetical protein ACFFD4_19265 [Candidatus Odinarchaeota archaeon]
MMVLPVQDGNCRHAENDAGVTVKDTSRTGLELTTVNLRVPLPAPVISFLEEEARKDSEDYKDYLSTSVLCSIKRRFDCYYRSSSSPEELANYRHLLSLMTEHGELLLAGDRAIEQHSSQQEDLHGGTMRETAPPGAGPVLIDLEVSMPAPVLEQLEQHALEDGDDFKRTLVAALLHVLQELFILDIPAGASNGRYRELFFLLEGVDV